jgi:hypothetical protein
MNTPTPEKLRLKELLAVPERDRTDEQWDEINQLEISLAPGNREGARDPNLRGPDPNQQRRNGGPMGPMSSGRPQFAPGQGQGQGQGRPGGGGRPQGKKKRFHRPKGPPS